MSTWRAVFVSPDEVENPNFSWLQELTQGNYRRIGVNPFLIHLGPEKFIKLINNQLETFHANLLIVNLPFGNQIDTKILSALSPKPIRMLWEYDSHIEFERTVLFAKFFDIVAVNDSAMEAMLSNYNIPTCLTMMENDPRIYYETGVPKDIDILFSGYLHKENRLVLLEAVKKRFSDYDCVFLDMVDKYLEPDEHADLTRRSKIVLNFAQGFLPFTKLLHANAYYAAPVPRILKQRILSSGLCGTACVSEFFAAAPNMFPYLRTFRSRTDLLTHLDQLLSDEKLLKDYTKQHAQHIQNHYSQSIMVRELSYKLHSVAPRAETLPVLIRVPWSRHYSVNATKSRLRKATTIKAIWSEFTWCRKGDDSFPAMPISTWLTAAAVALISRLVWSIARYIGQQPWARNRFNSLRNKRNTTNLI